MSYIDPKILECINLNYDRISCKNGLDELLDFVRDEKFMEIDEVVSVKKMAKVTSNMLKKYPKEVEDMFDRIYKLHCHGIELANKNSIEGIETMVSHLHAHACDVAKLYFKSTDDISWIKKGYEHSLKSIEFSKNERSPFFIPFRYRDVGDFSRILFDHEGFYNHGLESFTNYQKAAYMFEPILSKAAINCFVSGAKVAFELDNIKLGWEKVGRYNLDKALKLCDNDKLKENIDFLRLQYK